MDSVKEDILIQDINDVSKAKDQAYADMISAQEWYQDRSDKLQELKTALKELNK